MALDQKLERQFLARILRDVNAAAVAPQRKITEDYFEWTTAKKLYAIAIWYTQNYGSLLSINELEGLLKQSSTIQTDLQQSIIVLFTELQTEQIDIDINFLYDQIISYHKRNMLETAIRKSATTFSDRRVEDSMLDLKMDLARIDSLFRTEIIRSGQ